MLGSWRDVEGGLEKGGWGGLVLLRRVERGDLGEGMGREGEWSAPL